ncbi:hypothetical protein pb186bvf_020515 [Paramecium bursaria]
MSNTCEMVESIYQLQRFICNFSFIYSKLRNKFTLFLIRYIVQMQQEVLEPNEIRVNYIFYKQVHKCEIFYFEKLDLLIILHLKPQILIRVLTKGKDNQLHISESSHTRQIQRQIIEKLKQFIYPKIIVQEETEQIFILDTLSEKICTFQYVQKKFESCIINFEYPRINEFVAIEKYLIGFQHNSLCMFRKNNMKLVSRYIVECVFSVPERFHLLQVERDDEILYYKIASFKLKMIRKIQNDDKNQMLAFNERYFATYNNQQGIMRIIDSSNMRIQQYYPISNDCDYYPMTSSGKFFIKSDQIHNEANVKSLKLEQNSLVQKIQRKLNTLEVQDYFFFIMKMCLFEGFFLEKMIQLQQFLMYIFKLSFL